MGGASFVGRVVSNRMQKTVVVAVDYVVWQPKLKVYEKRISKHFAHDDEEACDIGDTVRIIRTRKLSKHKSYKVNDILRKVNVYTPELGAAAVEAALADRQAAQADPDAPKTRVDIAMAEYRQAQERLSKLQALRRAYEQDQAAADLTAPTNSSSSSSSSSSS